MQKQKVTKIVSTAIPLQIENVDTDQIIPARFLKSTTREGFGINVFRDWRYDSEGNPKQHFILNHPNYKGEILLAGHNFGCGSSREHAAWALSDYGFKAVVSSFFADIFKNNALNNSLLPVQVTPDFLKLLFETVNEDHQTKIVIDVAKQTISVKQNDLPAGRQVSETFDINPYKKVCVMNGYDDVDYLLNLKPEIEKFEKERKNDYSLVSS